MGLQLQNNFTTTNDSYYVRIMTDEDDKNYYERASLLDSSFNEEESMDFFIAPGWERYKNRQFYLHSYTFTREKTLGERMKASLSKFKAAAWAVMACNYRRVVPKKIKGLLSSTTRCLRSGVQLKMSLPQCLRI